MYERKMEMRHAALATLHENVRNAEAATYLLYD